MKIVNEEGRGKIHEQQRTANRERRRPCERARDRSEAECPDLEHALRHSRPSAVPAQCVQCVQCSLNLLKSGSHLLEAQHLTIVISSLNQRTPFSHLTNFYYLTIPIFFNKSISVGKERIVLIFLNH